MQSAVYILSIVGVADTAGRILSGLVYDIPKVRRVRPYAYVVFMLGLSATILGWAFCTDYTQIAFLAAVNGLFTGAMVTGRAIIVADVVGDENTARGFGLTNLGQGFGVLAGPLIAG